MDWVITMTLIKHIIEPNRLFVFWEHYSQNGKTKKKFKIGELIKDDGHTVNLTYFCDTDDFKQAVAGGCDGIYPYDISQQHHPNIPWAVFSYRIMPRKRDDFDDWCLYHKIDPKYAKNISDFSLLALTKGKLLGNQISFGLEYY